MCQSYAHGCASIKPSRTSVRPASRSPRQLFLQTCERRCSNTALLIVGRDVQGQQTSHRINGQMHFATFALLVSIVVVSMSAFRTRLQRAAIKNRSRGLFVASLGQSQDRSQIVDDCLKAAHSQPALGLLIHCCPRGQVVMNSSTFGNKFLFVALAEKEITK